MNVKKLIDWLGQFDPELPVYVSYDSGDYWGSVVAKNASDVSEMTLVYSAYHKKMQVPSNDDENYEDEKTVEAVVIG